MPSTTSFDRDLKLATGPTLLGLTVGSHDIAEAGHFVAKGDAQSTPTFTLPGASTDKTYTIIGLDPDAPTPTVNILGPVLHFLGTDYKADASGILTSSTNPYANWIAPNPPLPPSPHRYAIFVYEQPTSDKLKKYQPASAEKLGNFPRIRWDLDGFSREVGLGPAVAANYFTSR